MIGAQPPAFHQREDSMDPSPDELYKLPEISGHECAFDVRPPRSASYRGGRAGAQLTAQSERIRSWLVANRFHANSQAPRCPLGYEIPSWRASGCGDSAKSARPDRAQGCTVAAPTKSYCRGLPGLGSCANRHHRDHHGMGKACPRESGGRRLDCGSPGLTRGSWFTATVLQMDGQTTPNT